MSLLTNRLVSIIAGSFFSVGIALADSQEFNVISINKFDFMGDFRDSFDRTSSYTCDQILSKAETYDNEDYSIQRFVPWTNNEFYVLRSGNSVEGYFFKERNKNEFIELIYENWYNNLKSQSENLADFYINGYSKTNDCKTGNVNTEEAIAALLDDFSNNRELKFRKISKILCTGGGSSEFYENDFYHIARFISNNQDEFLIIMDVSADENFFMKRKGERKYIELLNADWDYHFEKASPILYNFSHNGIDGPGINCKRVDKF